MNSCMKDITHSEAVRVKGKYLFCDWNLFDWHLGWRTVNDGDRWTKQYPLTTTTLWFGIGPLDINFTKRIGA